LQRLNLVLKGVIYALTLDWVIHSLGTRYILHSHLGAKRHTLMDVSS